MAERWALVLHNLTAGGGVSVGMNLLAELVPRLPSGTLVVASEMHLAHPLWPDSPDVEPMVFSGSTARRAFFDMAELPLALRRWGATHVVALGNIPFAGERSVNAVLVHHPYLMYQRTHYRGLGAASTVKLVLLRRLVQRRLRSVDLAVFQTRVAEARFRSWYGYWGRSLIMPNHLSVLLENRETCPLLPLAPGDDRYRVLYLTRYYLHKNIEFVVDAFRSRSALGDRAQLVLTIDESHGPKARKLLDAISRSGTDSVINVGPVPQSALRSLYAAVDVAVVASSLESFSAAYLEPTWCDVPLVAADFDFAREVCGSGARFFRPFDPDSLTSELLAVIEALDQSDARKGPGEKLRSSGWGSAAEELIAALRGL